MGNPLEEHGRKLDDTIAAGVKGSTSSSEHIAAAMTHVEDEMAAAYAAFLADSHPSAEGVSDGGVSVSKAALSSPHPLLGIKKQTERSEREGALRERGCF